MRFILRIVVHSYFRLLVLLIFLANQGLLLFIALIVFLGKLGAKFGVLRGFLNFSIGADLFKGFWKSIIFPLLSSWRCSFNSFIGHILSKALKLSSTIASLIWAVPLIAYNISPNLISNRAIRSLISPKPIRPHHHLLVTLAIAPLIMLLWSIHPRHVLRTSHTIAIYKTLITSSSLKSSLISWYTPPLISVAAVPFHIGFKLLDVRLMWIIEFAYLKLLRIMTNIGVAFSPL